MRDTSSTLSVRLPQAPAQARGNRSDLACVLSQLDRKSTRLNSSHVRISYAVFCLKKKKVMLKRGMAATIEEWLMAAEYVAREGTSDMILFERLIRSYEDAYRYTLDLAAVPMANQL